MTELDVDAVEECDVAFVAYPHGAAAPVVAALRERGLRVVDLSADFRLHDPDATASWYGEHGAPTCSARPSTGSPSSIATGSREAELVANPGCYSTAAILGAGAARPRGADRGRGRRCQERRLRRRPRRRRETTHFVRPTENVTPYGVEGHRHDAEIDQELGGSLGGERRR